jgi:hypothetical protein
MAGLADERSAAGNLRLFLPLSGALFICGPREEGQDLVQILVGLVVRACALRSLG